MKFLNLTAQAIESTRNFLRIYAVNRQISNGKNFISKS